MDTWVQALAGFLAPTFAVYIAWRLRQIHVLVNSRLSDALTKINALEDRLGVPKDEREVN